MTDFERPLFLVAAPCAGTSPLFDLLSRAEQVYALDDDHRLQLRALLGEDRLTARDATPALIVQLRQLVQRGLRDRRGDAPRSTARWLSGAVANASQIPFLAAAFPDAQFIYLYRNVREQLARMMSGAIAPERWATTTAHILNDLAELPTARWCAVHIDDVLLDRGRESTWLGRFAGLTWRARPTGAVRSWQWGDRPNPHAQTVDAMFDSIAALDQRAIDAVCAHHPSQRDLPEERIWDTLRALPRRAMDSAAKTVAAGRIAAGLVAGRALFPTVAGATSFTVTTNADSGAGSLRDAILQANKAQGADTITFDPSLKGQTITLTGGGIKVADAIQIQGLGAAQLAIDGNKMSRAFYLYAPGTTPIDVSISGVTIQNAAAMGEGGGITAKNVNLTLDSVALTNNAATPAMGTSGLTGGGLFFDGITGGTLTIRSSTVSGNSVTGGGGGGIAINNMTGAVLFDTVTFTNNQVDGSGGALYMKGGASGSPSGQLTVQNCIVTGNAATQGITGGLLFAHLTGVTIQGTTISGNTSAGRGAGFFAYTATALTVDKSTISGNTAHDRGGGFEAYHVADLKVTNTTIAANTASNGAGGLFLYQSGGTFENCTISGNSSMGGGGGAGLNRATITFKETTISGNSATGIGGGLYARNTSAATIYNSIISGNTATPAADLANDTSSSFSASFSLIQTPGKAQLPAGTGVLTGMDPLLGALQANGGPTQTMVPGKGSPVIDSGDPAFAPPPAQDQRGEPRVTGAHVDMGAVEVQFCDTAQPGSTCDDGNACTIDDVCTPGGCVGTAKDCSNLNGDCSMGMCNPTTGACVVSPLNEGGTCTNHNACEMTTTCQAGACVAGVVKDCSSLTNACAVGICDAMTGQCQAQPINEGGACSDGNACTLNDTCRSGTCEPGPMRDCSSLDSACTMGSCNESTGQCEATPTPTAATCEAPDAGLPDAGSPDAGSNGSSSKSSGCASGEAGALGLLTPLALWLRRRRGA